MSRLTLDEAQQLDKLELRPSHVQRYCGPGSPIRRIVARGDHGPVGRRLLLACGHWREVRDFDFNEIMAVHYGKRKRQESARCGLCRLKYLPEASSLKLAQTLLKEQEETNA